eukprot:scaffold9253_cov19-Tisochrysis_lutea.AAC.1
MATTIHPSPYLNAYTHTRTPTPTPTLTHTPTHLLLQETAGGQAARTHPRQPPLTSQQNWLRVRPWRECGPPCCCPRVLSHPGVQPGREPSPRLEAPLLAPQHPPCLQQPKQVLGGRAVHVRG